MTFPQAVSAQLLDYDGSVMSGVLDNAFGVSFYDEWNGPGRGQVSLALSESGATDLLPGRFVNCLVDGTVRFTFKIEGNPDYDVIEEGEEYAEVMLVSGRGWACTFDEAITFPEYARNFVIETSWRTFSFASELFPNLSTWDPAYPYAEYLEGVLTVNCYGHQQIAPDGLAYPAPIGFPWPTDPSNLVFGIPTANYVASYWLRPSDMPEWNSTGYYFFRNEFTLTEDITAVLFTVTGDNFFTFFLEGVPILGEIINIGDHFMWQGWKEHKMFLPAGTYTVAAAVYNISWTQLGAPGPIALYPCPEEGYFGAPTDNNPGGLLACIFTPGDIINPPVNILTTNDTWDSYYDPTTWPGWTPGQIIQQLIDEAIARSVMTVYNSDSFLAFTDTDGDDWRPILIDVDRPDIPTFSVEVGTTLLAALQQLHEAGYINWHVRPGTLVLDVWRARLPASPASAATFAGGVNLLGYELNSTAPYANRLMVQWEGGYILVEDIAAIADYGTPVEDVYASDGPSEEEARIQGEVELLRRAQSAYPAIVAVVEPTSAADCPYLAYETGDWVTVPGGDVVRVFSVNCQQGPEGWATWTLELNAKLDVPERRTTQLLQQIGGRNQVVKGAIVR